MEGSKLLQGVSLLGGLEEQGRAAGEEGGINFAVFVLFCVFKKKEIAACMYAGGNDLVRVASHLGLPGTQDLQL